jgi:MFS family permease
MRSWWKWRVGAGRTERGVSPIYLLIVLALIYTSSFVDRAIVNILAEPIKRDLGLTDTELGILGGIAFAALYSVLGIPVARLAERKNRLFIITVAVTIWSLMTMLCAAATGFLQLAAARAGVGIGEAACTPCAHSMIGDSFPPDRRATAISIYSLGIPVGTVLGTLGGAWVANTYSWHAAFVAVGAPGLLLALLAGSTLKEPQRGRFDPPVDDHPPSLIFVLRHLWSRHAFRHLLAGVTLSTLISAGLGAFGAPFLLRSGFEVDLLDVALISALLVGCGTFVGTLVGGPLADRLSRLDERSMLRVPAIAYLITAPVLALAYASNTLVLFIGLSLVGQLTAAIYLGPTFGALHNMVEPRMRATAVAIVFMVVALVGIGFGPVLVGAISDYAAHAIYGVDPAHCVGLSAPMCSAATFAGLRAAMIMTALLYLWPAFHYVRAASRLSESLLRSGSSGTGHDSNETRDTLLSGLESRRSADEHLPYSAHDRPGIR